MKQLIPFFWGSPISEPALAGSLSSSMGAIDLSMICELDLIKRDGGEMGDLIHPSKCDDQRRHYSPTVLAMMTGSLHDVLDRRVQILVRSSQNVDRFLPGIRFMIGLTPRGNDEFLVSGAHRNQEDNLDKEAK